MGRQRIAVVIVNYNYVRYVAGAIDSVIAQSDPADQIIVVDDGSDDGSVEVLTQHSAHVELVLQANAGHGAAINAGWRRVDADLVVFLDADDLLHPDALAAARAAWRPGLAKLQWQMDVIDPLGAPTGALLPPDEPPAGLLRESLIRQGPEPVLFRLPPTSGNAWSVDLLRRVMPLDPIVWRVGPDTPLIVAAALWGEAATYPTPLSAYRVHSENQTWAGGARGKQLRDLWFLKHSSFMLRALCPDEVTEQDARRWTDESWPGRAGALWNMIVAQVPEGRPVVLLDDWWTGWTHVDGRELFRDEAAAAGAHVAVPWWHEAAPRGLALLDSGLGGVIGLRR